MSCRHKVCEEDRGAQSEGRGPGDPLRRTPSGTMEHEVHEEPDRCGVMSDVRISACEYLKVELKIAWLIDFYWRDDVVNVSQIRCACMDVMLGADSDDQSHTSDQP